MESGVPPYIGLPAMIGWASVSTGDRVADGLDVYPLVERPGSRIQAAGPRLSPNVPDMVCSSVSRWTMQLCSRLVRFSDTITRVRPTSRHAPAMNKNSKHAGAGDSEPVAGKNRHAPAGRGPGSDTAALTGPMAKVVPIPTMATALIVPLSARQHDATRCAASVSKA